jgi:uncharacterized protein (TIGR03083 family)
MESSARTWIGALRGSQQRLASLVGPLSPEQLRQPSYCSEWSIAQVLSHLGSQAEVGQAILSAVLAGAELPGMDDFKKIWAVWDAKDADDQAAQSLVQDAEQVGRYERLSDDELAGIRAPLFGMELDAAGLVWLRLGEHAMHSWDIAVSLDPAATVAGDCAGLLLDKISWVAGRAGKAGSGPYQAIIETTGPRRGFLLDVGESVSLTEIAPGAESPGDGVARIRMPGEALLRLVYGRLDADHTPPVEVGAGDISLDRLRQTFPGF